VAGWIVPKAPAVPLVKLQAQPGSRAG
jgi:hypothetical protein